MLYTDINQAENFAKIKKNSKNITIKPEFFPRFIPN